MLFRSVADGLQPEGMESLIPLLVDNLKLLSDFLPKNFEAIFIEKERVIGRITDLLVTNDEFREAAWSSAAIGGKTPIELGRMDQTYVDWDELISYLDDYRDFRQFGGPEDQFIDLQPIEALRNNGDKLIELLSSALKTKKKIIFSLSSRGMIDR